MLDTMPLLYVSIYYLLVIDQVVTPYYFKPQLTDEAWFQHFNTVANASPIPIIIYNVTNFTGS